MFQNFIQLNIEWRLSDCRYYKRRLTSHLKMFSKLFRWLIKFLLLFLIFIFVWPSKLLMMVNSQPQSTNPILSCQQNIEHCLNGNSFERLPCSMIKPVQHCLERTKNVCVGHISYHTLLALVTKGQCNRNYNSPFNSRNSHHNHHHSHQQPPTRSMSPGSPWHQQLTFSSNQNPKHGSNGGIGHEVTFKTKPEYFPYCLEAAYNYTIGTRIISRNNYISEQQKLQSQIFYRHRRLKRQLDISMIHKKANEIQRPKLSESTIRMATDLIYKPIQPMTPSLTCIIFGDPHLRTFDSRYQMCNCTGTRSLLEHPLFDVQITNSQIQDHSNSTGVTKVIVLVRRFSPCAISNELIYETDSLTQTLPSTTFTDGSSANFNYLVHITSSMNGKVVTIHLEHIGVRVHISQFERTKFLNVVIKFLTAKSNLVRQELVLEAINSISLCKSGCHPKRELINIEQELGQANIDIESNIYKNQFSDLYSSNTEDDDIDYDDYVDKDEDEDYGEFDYEDDDVYANENHDSQRKLQKIRRNLNNNNNNNRKRKRNRKKISITSTTTTKAPKMDKKNRLRSIHPTLGERKKSIDYIDDSMSTDLNINRWQIINDCYNNKLIGYYRLACLYDTIIKGTTSTYPFFFAASFDEPRLMNLNKPKFVNISKNSNSNYSSSSTILLPSNMFSIIILGIIIDAIIFIFFH